MNTSFAAGCQIPEVVADYVQWACQSANDDRRDITFSVNRSRISNLYKPEQLQGFELIDQSALVPILMEVAAADSEITGRFVTPALDAKKAAIEWLQCMGEPAVWELNESIVLDETNAYVAHGVATLTSATPQQEFSSRLKQLLESSSGLECDQSENEDFFRRSAAIRLAHASDHRDAFLSIIRFNYLRDGHVLLSLVDAIVDLAVARTRAGDDDVIHQLDSMVRPGATSHHRAAGVAVWCNLIAAGHYPSKEGHRLWDYAMDETLDDFSHQDAIVALASSPEIPATTAQLQWLWTKANNEDDKHHLQAACAFVGRGSLSNDQVVSVIKLLDGVAEADRIRLSKPEALTIWQANLLASTLAFERHRFISAVGDVITKGTSDAVHQLVPALLESNPSLPDSILDALSSRVRALNTTHRADTALISVLGQLSPTRLLDTCQSEEWTDWIEPGRVALARSIHLSHDPAEGADGQIASAFVALIRDPSFLVRRCAYRGFARTQPMDFAKHVELLASSLEPDLALRAAEAMRWLDAEYFDDDFLRELNLQSHRLPEVREVAQTAILERRDRLWANSYLSQIEQSVQANVLKANEFRYGLALKALGDDETIEQLTNLANLTSVAPRIRFWLEGIRKAVQKNWQKILKQHAEPWSLLYGTVEAHNGAVRVSDDENSFDARIYLWKHERRRADELYTWGGIVVPTTGSGFSLMDVDYIDIEIPGRISCKGLINSTNYSDSHDTRITFSGQSAWPEKQ